MCASSPHINAKLHDVPAQHENLRQAQYHANLDYDAAPKWIAIGSVECRSSNGGGVPETPPTQQNRNGIFKFWLITKQQRFQLKGSAKFLAVALSPLFVQRTCIWIHTKNLRILTSKHPWKQQDEAFFVKLLSSGENFIQWAIYTQESPSLPQKKESTPRQQMFIPDNTFVIFNHLRNANLSAKKRNSWLETT